MGRWGEFGGVKMRKRERKRSGILRRKKNLTENELPQNMRCFHSNVFRNAHYILETNSFLAKHFFSLLYYNELAKERE